MFLLFCIFALSGPCNSVYLYNRVVVLVQPNCSFPKMDSEGQKGMDQLSDKSKRFAKLLNIPIKIIKMFSFYKI